MKRIKSILLLTSVIFFSACSNKENSYDANGTFEATEILVSSEVSGKIMQFEVQEGQLLDSGQCVGYIDTIQLYLKKKQLEAGINSIKTRRPEIKRQIAALEHQLSVAKNEKKRIENLVLADAVGKKQLDDINAQIGLIERQLDAQKSTLEISNRGMTEDISTMEIQVEQVADQLNKSMITSPIKGTLLVKYAERGELAVMGKSLFKIADLENMILRAYITSDQLTQLKIGDCVKVFSDFGKETKEYSGNIIWISGKSEFTPKTIQTREERDNLVYAIKIAVKNDGYLKIGMYGSIKL